MVRQRHQLDGHEFEQTLRDSGEERSLASCSPWDHRVRHDFATEQQQSLPGKHQIAFSCFPFIYPHIVPQHTHFFHSHPTSFAHSPKLHLGWTNYLSLQTRIVLRVKFNSVQLLSPVPLFATLWTASHQASLSTTNSQSLLKLMSIESVMPSNHLIPCHPFFLPSIFPSISVFSNESVLCIRWSKYWNFSFSISPSNEYSGLMSFRMDWLDLLAVQGTLKSLLQHHSLKASILWHSAFFIVQLSYPSLTTGKTKAMTRWTFVGKVMSLLFSMLSRLVITFLLRSKHLLVSCLQSPSAVILKPPNKKSATVSIVFPSICQEVMGPDTMILVF